MYYIYRKDVNVHGMKCCETEQALASTHSINTHKAPLLVLPNQCSIVKHHAQHPRRLPNQIPYGAAKSFEETYPSAATTLLINGLHEMYINKQ